MDPNQALADLREALRRMGAATEPWEYENAAAEAGEHIAGLDEWLSKGGFLPEAWRR